MNKKGFFPFNKRTMSFIAVILVLAIIMFTPWVYDAHTAGGTSYQFIIVGIILCLAPLLSLLDGWLRSK